LGGKTSRTPQLVVVPPPQSGVFRLSRGPANPFSPPDWEYAGDDGTFGNRFDDPRAEQGKPSGERFRIVYCATQRAGAFGETLARFRPSLNLLAELQLIDDEESTDEALAGVIDQINPGKGLIPADWRLRRRMGKTVLDPSQSFVDIAASQSMQHLRTALAPLANRLRLSDVDLSSVTSQQRRFTQGCAQHVYEQVNEIGEPRFAGIRYPSRLNGDWECWAIFSDRIQHTPGYPGFPESILADDSDLLSVASLFGLIVEIVPGTYLRP
jgi:RES domain